MSEQPYHKWEATGVTGYPITHPIVGQSDFFHKLKSYLQLVGNEENKFLQVFALIALWGVGKSRLGYEIIAQVNDASKGWKIRDKDKLIDAHLFDDDKERQQYLNGAVWKNMNTRVSGSTASHSGTQKPVNYSSRRSLAF